MDLETLRKRIEDRVYPNAFAFEADMLLIFKNCYKFNPVGNIVRTLGQKFEALWKQKWNETLPAIKAALHASTTLATTS
ncbi:hypothetical protein HMI54_007656, partial [Coelomomyces lativittatus]